MRRLLHAVGLAGACALLGAAPALAAGRAAPANDARSSAQILTIPADLVGSTGEATADPTDPQCGTQAGPTVWYRVTTQAVGQYLVTFQGDGKLDAVVAVYRDEAGQLRLVSCLSADVKGAAAGAFTSTASPTAPETYLVSVGQKLTSQPGSFQLKLTPTKPVNDDRYSAQILSLPALVTGTTVEATADEGDPQCTPRVGPSVWYRLTRVLDGRLAVELQTDGTLGVVVSLYRSEAGQLKLLQCVPTGKDGAARFVFASAGSKADPGVYLFLVGQKLASQPGAFTLKVGPPDRPDNDELVGAVNIGLLPATAEGTTEAATHDAADPECTGSAPTVWYRFATRDGGRVKLVLRAGGRLDGKLCVYESARAGLEPVAEAAMGESGVAEVGFDAKSHTGYALAVAQKGEVSGKFTLAGEPVAAPANDVPARAEALVAERGKLAGTTVGATHAESDPECAKGGGTVWYRFSLSRGKPIAVQLVASPERKAVLCLLELRDGKVSLAATEAAGEQGSAAVHVDGHGGSGYLVAVGQPTGAPQGQFSIELLLPLKPPQVPGDPLPAAGGKGRLDPLLNLADAWSVTLKAGVSYRLTLVTQGEACAAAGLYGPGATDFGGRPILVLPCGPGRIFTPGAGRSGTYSILVVVGDEPVGYRVVVGRSEPDDVGPGVPLKSGQAMGGVVSELDPLDLYRFEVLDRSDVEVTMRGGAHVALSSAAGRVIRRADAGGEISLALGAGRYFVAVTGEGRSAGYRLTLLVRSATATSLAVGSGATASLMPGMSVELRASTTPPPAGGSTRIEAAYEDVSTGGWVFRKAWQVGPSGSATFTPDADGRWRVRAVYLGTNTISPSGSGWHELTVERTTTAMVENPRFQAGNPLRRRGVAGTVRSGTPRETNAAWHVALVPGTTYRVSVLSEGRACLPVQVVQQQLARAPLARTPAVAPSYVVQRIGCTGVGISYGLVTPGPEASRRATVVVQADSRIEAARAQRFTLRVAPAEPDDTAPGLPLRTTQTVEGTLAPAAADTVDLYRFEVPGRSDLADLELAAAKAAAFDLRVIDASGRQVSCACGETGPLALKAAVEPGRYFAEVRARGAGGAGRYALTLHVRSGIVAEIVQPRGSVWPGSTAYVSLRLIGQGSTSGGSVEWRIERYDPLQGWVYATTVTSTAGHGWASLSWRPPVEGRWRVRAQFLGTDSTNRSRSSYGYVTVERPLGRG